MITKEELIKQIEDKISSLDKPYPKLKEFLSLKEITEKNSFQTLEEYQKIDIIDLLKAALYSSAHEEEVTLDYLEDIIKPIRNFHRYTSIKIQALFYDEIMKNVLDDEKRNQMKEEIESNSFFRRAYKSWEVKVETSLKDDDASKTLYQGGNINTISQDFKLEKEASLSILQLMEIFPVRLVGTLTDHVMDYYLSLYSISELQNAFKDIDEERRQEKRFIKKRLSSSINPMKKIEEGRVLIDIVSNYVKLIEQEEKKYNKKQEKERSILTRIKNKLNEEKKEEITDYKEYIDGLKDEELIKQILMYIYEKNNKYYERIEQEYQEVQKNSINQYKRVLKKYQITNEKSIIHKIMIKKVEEVEEVLNILKDFPFKEEDKIEILIKGSIESIRFIKESIEKGYLEKEYVLKNKSLFYKESTEKEELLTSWKILDQFHINRMLLKKQIYVLIKNHYLEENLKTLEEYNLLSNLKKAKNLEFLTFPNLKSLIEKWIELDFFEILKEDIDLLNNQKVERLRVYQVLEITLNKEEIKKVLSSDKFIIKEEEIDTYLPVKRKK